MIEKHIILEDVDPVMFYGVGNAHLQMIKSLYPKLRIVARDNVLRVLGDEEEMAKAEEDIELMRKHLAKYNMLNEEDILDIVKGKQTKADSVKGVLVYSISGRPIKSRSENQQQLIEAYEKNDMVFAVGPAGTGKTYLSIALAVKALKEKTIKKIILSRPAVEAGEKLGFLPGDMKDKIDPYLQPLYDALEDMIPAVKLQDMMEKHIIQIAPLAFMRGRTLSDAVVILDEAQNTTSQQIRMFLTRMGMNTKMIITGDLTDEQIDEFDVAVLSPGVPTDIPMVNSLRDRGVKIWGEIELAYTFGAGEIIAITGTNGKTTTTALTGEIMKNYFKDVRVVGNIGIPYTSMVTGSTGETVTVAEISSFQLETIDTFKPHVSAILNITPDHLNRHHTMENYIRAKEDITKNQTADDYCVLNYEDEVLRDFAAKCPAKVIFFSSKSELSEGFYLDGDIIIYAHDGVRDEVIDVNELNLLGKHNFENVMAACAMSISFGVPMDKIVEVLKVFKAVEHRIEYVTEKRGVRFYNDSKGTNPDAAIQGIRAMNRPTLLIGGGYDKQSEYDEWIEAFDGKVKELVLIGQTADKIEECAHRHGFMNTVKKDTFEDAVNYCYEHAVSGDAVLLSPACASWGMFPNYEERGRIFKEIVKGFKE